MARGRLVAGLGVLVLLAGCSDSPEPTPTKGASATPSAPATGGPVETRTVDAAGDMLTMSALPLARTGETVVASFEVRLDHASGGGGSSLVTRHFSTVTAGPFDNVRLVDPLARRVYTAAPGADGNRCVCTRSTRVRAGESQLLSVTFSGVPPSVTVLSAMLPYAGVFADLPVSPGERATPGGPDGSDPTNAGSADLDAYTERLDVGLSTRQTPSRVDLSLDADVLFALDSAALTPAGNKVVAAAVADVRAAGPGPLTVTGHTDSTSSAAHNQDLSERRAATVAAALSKQVPDDRWPKKVTGKGETEPAFPNDTADHRRRNRRVTISYRPSQPAAASKPATVPLPQTKGTQATGTPGADVSLPLGRGTVRFSAGAAVRRGPFVQVDLLARNVGDDDATILSYLGQGAFTVRDELDPFAPYGASGVRMLSGDTAYYNLDYLSPGHGHRCLCDRLLNTSFPPGSTRTISLWYPAPPPGTPSVVLDVPDALRLTGIPVR